MADDHKLVRAKGRPIEGIGKTGARQAFPRAPTFLKFNSEALVRLPQPMPSTHTVYVFGSNGTAEGWRGRTDPPF